MSAKYDIVYMMRKAMKESVIANHLANNTIKDYEPLNFDFSDEDVLVVEEERELNWWTMYFDRVLNVYDNGAGIMIISPKKSNTLSRSNYSLNAPIILLSIKFASSG